MCAQRETSVVQWTTSLKRKEQKQTTTLLPAIIERGKKSAIWVKVVEVRKHLVLIFFIFKNKYVFLKYVWGHCAYKVE